MYGDLSTPTGFEQSAMKYIETYVSPVTHAPLRLDRDKDQGVITGRLVSDQGEEFAIRNGIPDFTHPPTLPDLEARTRDEYDAVAEQIYDAAVDWQFEAMYEDEDRVREEMIDWLELEPDFRVLEIGAGTGRDTFRIARRLGGGGQLFIQDLSPAMVERCREVMSDRTDELDLTCEQHFFISNARYLPFSDSYFDAVFHFGGFNHFSEKPESLEEFARVTREGGKIVCGDEAVAPWLRGTEFEGIVTANNPLFEHEAPLDALPVGARNVSVHWIMANCFYVFDFAKGEGPPRLDLDLPHAGSRGGTMRTRYYGRLEGVTPEGKAMVEEAAAKAGLSRHEWLDRVVREAARKEIGGER